MSEQAPTILNIRVEHRPERPNPLPVMRDRTIPARDWILVDVDGWGRNGDTTTLEFAVAGDGWNDPLDPGDTAEIKTRVKRSHLRDLADYRAGD